MPILLAIEKDSASFHVYDRRVGDSLLSFRIPADQDLLVDENTNSSWTMDGLCFDGVLKEKDWRRSSLIMNFGIHGATFTKPER
ncbi:hypothetical protein ACQ86N_15120 [Puia sp. P3]|uniref:hypothetical protein n=1 Tax=Puia sp. P3 TaxID=3423952 RepID=UPI003D67F2D0